MYEDRRKSRQIKIVAASMKLRTRTTATNLEQLLEELRVVCLSAEAGNRALWKFLLAKGMVNEAERQDWLDEGVMDILAQIDMKAAGVLNIDGKPN